MADDLKKHLENALKAAGKKTYFFGFVTGKRIKDPKGDFGDLDVVVANKTFKKEDFKDAVPTADVKAFAMGKLWGSKDGKILYISGKGVNAGIVDKMTKSAYKLTNKAFDIQIPNDAEEERATKLGASGESEQQEGQSQEGTAQTPGGGRGAVGWMSARVEARDKLHKLEAILAKTRHPLAGATVKIIQDAMKKFDVDVTDKAKAQQLKTLLASDPDIADLEATQFGGDSFGVRNVLLRALEALEPQLPS